MNYNVILTPLAREDLKCIQYYYAINFSKDTARKVTNSILKSIDRLETFPTMGSQLKFDNYIREMDYRIVLSEDYGSIYRIIGQDIYVYHIVNTKMDYKKLFYMKD